jgi:hypothetical protein
MLTPMHMLLAIMDFAFGDHSTSIINGPNCTFDEFACNDGKCIPNQSVCDHMVDCSDGNDEIDCNDKNPSLIDQAGQLCRLDEFTCNDGNCISMKWICDGNDDCSDGYDEINCNQAGQLCRLDEFTCNDGNCISMNLICDDNDDCSDGYDEINCNQAGQLCRLDEFTCNDSKCISMNWICDGNDDCSDGYDEINCNSNCGSIGSYCDHFCSQNQCQCYSGYQLINLYECVRFNETYLYSSAFGNKFTMTILVYLLILNIII